MFRTTNTNGKADFEITKDKLNLDFSADIVSGSSWKRNQPYTEKLILPGNITINQNDDHTSNNFDQQYNLNNMPLNNNGLNNPHVFIIGITSKINLDFWHNSMSKSELFDVAFKRIEYILDNNQNDSSSA